MKDASAHTRQRLHELRQGLLRLHKALLESERVSFERIHGRTSSGELLQLAVHDPWFAWLRPLSALVVQIDEALDANGATGVSEADVLMEQVRRLLAPSEEGKGFGRHYYDAMQRDPDVVLAHAGVAKLLRRR